MMHGLSSLAEAEIEGLEADGVTLTPHEVIHVQALADLVETPGVRMALSRGKPIEVGCVYLWPLTMAAAEWWSDLDGQLGSRSMHVCALGYAMAHGRDPLPAGKRASRRAVKAWRKTLRCRPAELEEAISQIQEQEYEIETEETETGTVGDMSLMLAAMTGTPPSVWEYQCSMSYASNMLSVMIAQNNADGVSTKTDPKIKAERALGLCVKRIRDRHMKAKEKETKSDA